MVAKWNAPEEIFIQIIDNSEDIGINFILSK